MAGGFGGPFPIKNYAVQWIKNQLARAEYIIYSNMKFEISAPFWMSGSLQNVHHLLLLLLPLCNCSITGIKRENSGQWSMCACEEREQAIAQLYWTRFYTYIFTSLLLLGLLRPPTESSRISCCCCCWLTSQTHSVYTLAVFTYRIFRGNQEFGRRACPFFFKHKATPVTITVSLFSLVFHQPVLPHWCPLPPPPPHLSLGSGNNSCSSCLAGTIVCACSRFAERLSSSFSLRLILFVIRGRGSLSNHEVTATRLSSVTASVEKRISKAILACALRLHEKRWC